jgi:methyl-accepting chemotaxis protein
METELKMSELSVDRLLEAECRRADRLMIGILWSLFAVSLALAGLHGTLAWALAVGLPAAALPTAWLALGGGSRAARVLVGAALMVFCALHIHQAAGRTEAHFGIFALLAFLLCYRDWLPVATAAAVVALHHLSFNYLQQIGFPTYCLTQPGIGTVLVHAAYVVVETSVLCYLAGVLRREAVQAAELRIAVAAMTLEPGRIDLRPVAGDSDSARALEGVLGLLRQTLSSVQDSVRQTTDASGRIAGNNAELAQHMAHQGASIGATVRSMAELTGTVRQNAEHARQADQLAGAAAQVATRGGEVVGEVVQTMDAIDAASRRIVDITGVIDGIAFQTNILALNAAVEAARAGEQGRGFAVVAGEVRSLAQRAAGAAREIKGLIEDSVAQVEAGSALVRQAGSTMDDVVASVRKVSGIIAEISSASGEQAQELAAIGQAMASMDAATIDSAARVDEAADAAVALKAQAAELARAVAVFRVEDGQPGGGRRGAVFAAGQLR